MPRLERGPGNSFIVYGRGYPADGQLVQSDWEFPRLAQDLGWSLLQVQVDKDGKIVHLKKVHREHSKVNCQHSGTDGTVNCRDCGITASDFITAAGEWLDKRVQPSSGRR